MFRNIIAWTYYSLFFTIPLVVYPYTSELFEFNKIIILYTLTTLIIALFLTEVIVKKKFEIKRTPLDLPLLLFLGGQGIATLFSIDFRTSLLGYYGRFNGGMTSLICYSILYWIFVSTMNKKQVTQSIYALLASSIFVCLYGIAQHFGIDKDIWVQDVQNRIFSSLGQPNWLAAWVVALIPITWALGIKYKTSNIKYLAWIVLSALLTVTLLYTKSRSGILSLGISFLIFWSLYLLSERKQKMKPFIVTCSMLAVICLIIGTPWSSSLMSLSQETSSEAPKAAIGTSLETGGTESGDIRKIVWQGAIDMWKAYPIFGTGVETFAFGYYMFKPEAHNYTSEWDYLYNKAHNEYLNYLATTGIVGFGLYLFFIGAVLYLFFRLLKNKESESVLIVAFSASYVSILATNFFGFSVVPVNILFYLLPAFAICLSTTHQPLTANNQKLTHWGKVQSLAVICLMLYVLSSIARYWYADTLFAKGRRANAEDDALGAQKALSAAIKISPNESIYWDELSLADRNIAIALSENKELEYAKSFAKQSVEDSDVAMRLSPANVNIKRNRSTSLIRLSAIDPSYLPQALPLLQEAVKQAPTDPKLQYNLAAMYYRLGQMDTALSEMQKAVDMKKDYKDSRYALGLMYIDAKKPDRAKEEFEYILKNIDPNDQNVKKELEELKTPSN